MPVITISRGSYSKGKEVAEKMAQKLGYKIISRDIILKTSEELNVPEIRLIRAIHDAPSILDRLSFKKEKYIAYIRAALLQQFCKDNIVYHGLAGQFFVKSIPHVLKVRILSNMEDRVQTELEREGISKSEALRVLKKDDEERRKWSQHLYGIDTRDSSLYDLVIHINKITIDDAVDILCHTAGLEHFQATPESEKSMNDLALTAVIQAALFDIDREAAVTATEGSVFVKTRAPLLLEEKISNDIRNIVKDIPNVKDVNVKIEPIIPVNA